MFNTWLPLPPSSNTLFATNWRTKQRFPSEAYEKWKVKAEDSFKVGGQLIEGRIHAVYRVIFPIDKRPRDIENYSKAVSDFLVKKKVMHDDSQIDHLELIRSHGAIPGVFITLHTLPSNQCGEGQ